MARRRRSLALNTCHHVMLRGIDGERIFKEKYDFCRFCLMLQKATEDHQFQVHAFCFMSNHLHLVIEPRSSPLHTCVHAFAARYAQFFNRKYKRRGYLFQGRFRSVVVSDGIYLRRLIRYIHLNPVVAKITRAPEDYPWSSHKAYMTLTDYAWLTKDYVLSRFGKNVYDAVVNLLQFTSAKVDAEADLEEIHAAFAFGAYGDEDFVHEHVERPIISSPLPIKYEVGIEQLIEEVTKLFGITPQQLAGSGRQQKIVNARSVLALFAREVPYLSLYSVARALHKSHGTISRLAARAEASAELPASVDDLLKITPESTR